MTIYQAETISSMTDEELSRQLTLAYIRMRSNEDIDRLDHPVTVLEMEHWHRSTLVEQDSATDLTERAA